MELLLALALLALLWAYDGQQPYQEVEL